MNSNNRVAATLYSLGTFLRNVNINTLHKGDNNNGNNNYYYSELRTISSNTFRL